MLHSLTPVLTPIVFALSLASVAGNGWVTASNVYAGLWKVCSKPTSICAVYGSVPNWLQAVQAFSILTVIFAFLLLFLSFSLLGKPSTRAYNQTFFAASATALCSFTAVAVFTGEYDTHATPPQGTLGWAYGLQWVTAAGALIVAISNLTLAHLLDAKAGTDTDTIV